MTEWADTAAVLLAFRRVMDGSLRMLREALPEAIRPEGPSLGVFEGLPGTGGAGMFASITARHGDGRQLFWQVELWADREPEDGHWWATVKGEIDHSMNWAWR